MDIFYSNISTAQIVNQKIRKKIIIEIYLSDANLKKVRKRVREKKQCKNCVFHWSLRERERKGFWSILKTEEPMTF